MNPTIKTIKCAAIFTLGVMAVSLAQEEDAKAKERYNTNKDVGVYIDSQNTDLIFEDWNKDEVEVEAVLETKGLTQEQRQQLLQAWQINVRGNSGRIDVTSSGSNFAGRTAGGGVQMSDLNELMASSMAAVQPLMQNMIAPMLQNMAGNRLPPAYYENMKTVQFDYDAYKKQGEKYLKAYQKKMESSIGDDFQKVMQHWIQENESKMTTGNGSFLEGLKNMPASPFGKDINFDTSTYKNDKKGYTASLNKKYTKNASVKEVEKWLADMKTWSGTFSKNMEAWGQDFGAFFGSNMEVWGQQFLQQAQQLAANQNANFSKMVTRDANGNMINTQVNYSRTLSSGNNPSGSNPLGSSIKRKIIVRMPKAAKLDLSVRHGNIEIGEASDARVNLSHGNFIAQTIDGSKTYVTVAYSPVDVNSWNYGTLRTSYVKSCIINQAEHINLNSRASNILINELGDTAVISGSFGELTIPKIGRNFHTINISLENSDLVLRLPETSYNFAYSGVQSNLNFPKKLDAKVMRGYGSQMVNGFYKKEGSDKSITISSKFSDVVVN